tara:strand:- start:2640 stop:3821 length:1182 start_codon:yes stop_codon:yes gene_type:complete
MKKVLLRAPLLTNSGYGVHSRQIYKWLEERSDVELHVECLHWGLTSWIVDTEAEDGLFGRIMSRAVGDTRSIDYDISVQVQLPDEWDTTLARKNIGVTALVETDVCNLEWIKNINEMDHVIVPSNFTKKVIMDTAKFIRPRTPISVVPEWFNENLFNERELSLINQDERYNFDTRKNLLVIGTLTSQSIDDDRKNLVNTISWALEALKDSPEVGIIAKVSVGKSTSEDRKITLEFLNSVVKSFRKGPYPRVHLIHGHMTDAEIAGLYSLDSVIGYISATRGEGYGLPIIDAAASGIPVVTTNWSGHLDFLDKKFLKVDYDLVKISETRVDERIFVKNAKWANPKKESFQDCLRELIANQEKYSKRSQELKRKVRRKFSKKSIIKIYDKIFQEI